MGVLLREEGRPKRVHPTLTKLCQLPAVPSNEGLSLTPQINNPNFDRKLPAITTWGYKNHSIRDENLRYTRYRDGSEELFDHKKDPHEHKNVAYDANYKVIKQQLRRWLPQHNQLPAEMSEFKGDFLEDRLKQWQENNGIPDWLV